VKKPRLNLRQREALEGWICISPYIIGFLIFFAGPLVSSMYFSFTNYDVLRPPRWVGLENYARILFEDDKARLAFSNSVIYAAMYVPLSLLVALILALLLNTTAKGMSFFRTAFYLPSITPQVAMGIMWMWILNPRVGIINRMLRAIGLPGPGWITDPKWVKPGLVLMGFWSVGGTMVIYLAGLKQIPRQLYEAARIDGASGWQQFIHVTLPQLSGVIFFTLVMGIISALQVFTEAYVMFDPEGGKQVGNAALFYNMYLFNQGFRYFRMGYASAMAWLLFVVVLILTIIQMKTSKYWVHY
jgi:multiple sugar transport system permease protein